jgi:hypothetical protein
MNVKTISAAICFLGLFCGCDKKPAVTVRATAREKKIVFTMSETQPATRPTTQNTHFSYVAPKSWKLDSTLRDNRLATFTIGQSTSVVASEFESSSFNNQLGNINRWRDQAMLPPVETLEQQPAEEVEIGPFKGRLFDISNPPSVRLVVAVLPREQSVRYFKLMGPADEVASALSDFRAFLKSIDFN